MTVAFEFLIHEVLDVVEVGENAYRIDLSRLNLEDDAEIISAFGTRHQLLRLWRKLGGKLNP